METIRITTSQNIDIDYEVAGLGERVAARLIDLLIFFVLYLIGLVSFIGLSLTDRTLGVVVIIFFLAAFVFYDLVCELTMNGQSIGKKIMKIRVISLDGGRPSFGQYLLRWFFRLIDFGISLQACALIMAAVTEKKQRLGDVLAGTILIKTNPKTDIDHIAFGLPENNYEPVYHEVTMLSDREIELIHEVIRSYQKAGNIELVFNMADQIKQHLGVAPKPGMHALNFLETVIMDYTFLTSRMPV